MRAQDLAIIVFLLLIALICIVFAIGGIMSRRRAGEGMRAMALREAETEAASQPGAAPLHVRSLSDDDAEHVLWASALSRELPTTVSRAASVPAAPVQSDFDRHVASVMAVLNKPDAAAKTLTLALDMLERTWANRIDKLFGNLPEWARA